MKIASGFKGERRIVVPHNYIELMEDNPLTGDLFVTSIGFISHAAYHYNNISEDKDSYLLVYCANGKGVIESEKFNYDIDSNQYVVVGANHRVTIKANEDEPWTIYWVLFRGAKAKIFASLMGVPTTILPAIHYRIEDKIEMFESIFTVMCGSLNLDKLNFANIMFINFLASFIYVDILKDNLIKPTSYAQSIINKATHFMSEHIECKITLKELSEYTGYSKSYFHRIFIEQMGESPIDYFIKMKINKASIYLIKSGMSVTQISSKLGFSTSEYFSKTFKKVVGLTPVEFRKQGFRL